MQMPAEKITPPPEKSFQPFVPASADIPEFTFKAVVLGIIFAWIFGAVTVYLGLKLGLTVTASFPIVVMAIMIFKQIGKSTILENNIVQTIGSAGEAVAAGVIFTLPAAIFMGYNLEYWKITAFALCGGWLGILFMIPLRRALIVREHETLPYPEGVACADILIAGEKKGVMARRVFQGVGLAFFYKVAMGVGLLWKEAVSWTSKTVFPGMTASVEVGPELAGIGYIIGPHASSIMVAGGILAWMCLIPMIKFFASTGTGILAPGTIPISAMEPFDIWRNYVRYIGAGAVVVGGFYNLMKSLPTILGSFAGGIKSFGKERAAAHGDEEKIRTERDMPNKFVFGGAITVAILLWGLLSLAINPGNPLANLVAALLMVIFGFFFVTVSSRVAGAIGMTNNPISGDTIATLMITCLIFVVAGWTGGVFAIVALSVGAVICIAAANGGLTSQDLKTGYLVGSTPKHQQYGLMIGVTASAFVVGLTLLFMNSTYRKFTELPAALKIPPAAVSKQTVAYKGENYHIGIVKEGVEGVPAGRYAVAADGTSALSLQEGIGGEKLSAPQGRLMSLVIDGILTQKLPWVFILAGGFISFTMILCGVTSVLSFAVGLYLPLSTTMPVFVGGMVRALVNRTRARKLTSRSAADVDEGDAGMGSLFSAGLVAGGALGGILVAGFQNWERYKAWMDKPGKERWVSSFMRNLTESDLFALAVFAAVAVLMYLVGRQSAEDAK